jgi:hypothetical protein
MLMLGDYHTTRSRDSAMSDSEVNPIMYLDICFGWRFTVRAEIVQSAQADGRESDKNEDEKPGRRPEGATRAEK